MSTRSARLAELLHPETCETFFRLHWEKKPLHVSRPNAAGYAHLLTLGELEQLVASPQMRFPAIQLSKDGHYFPAAVFTEDVKVGPDVFTGMVSLQRLNAEYRAGATAVLPGLHLTSGPLAAL